LRRPAHYSAPRYIDPDDRKVVQAIEKSSRPMPRAVNILGIPFDGAVLGRKGAAGGPRAIRESMGGFSDYNIELGVGVEGARVFDLGDMVVARADVVKAHEQIEEEVARDISRGSLLVLLGGDNSISLPALRASGRKFRRLGLVVIDSHLDLRGRIRGKPTSGSSYGLAIETVRGLDPSRTVEIGVHGFLNSKKYADKAKDLGIKVITPREVRRVGSQAAAREAYGVASAGADAVYLSIDLDAVDLSQVSGVSAPSVGGLNADEVASIAFELSTCPRVRVADVVELAPSLDPTGRSQRVAATVLMNLIAGYGARPGNVVETGRVGPLGRV
jgi:formimidoylglutamase